MGIIDAWQKGRQGGSTRPRPGQGAFWEYAQALDSGGRGLWARGFTGGGRGWGEKGIEPGRFLTEIPLRFGLSAPLWPSGKIGGEERYRVPMRDGEASGGRGSGRAGGK